ncbi:MAG TPA: hypothetical protein VLT61_14775 [Anaeromyxobacteraceae bacterium]|nr:hypothetical protein [Anaeromyxobacteraceae bacterium]
MAANGNGMHRWRFHRIGGLDQVSLTTGADLAHLDQLDPKLWVALGCPTHGLELDAKTLEFLDADKDGRVRVPEILAAVRWCAGRLADLGSLVPGAPALPLAAISTATPEGKALLGAARQILSAAGKAGAIEVAPADVADLSRVFEKTPLNGDGLVPADAAADPETRQVILDAIACVGSEPDRSGQPGIGAAKLEAFWKELQAYADWWARAEATAGVLPLGDATPAAHACFATVRARVDDYFVRCGLAAVDPRAAGWLGRTEAEWTALAARDLSAGTEASQFPLARIEPGRPLPLQEGVNPAWRAALEALRLSAAEPLLGPGTKSLTAVQWEGIKAKLAPFEAHLAAKAGAAVEPLGLARVKAVLAGGGRAAVEALIAADKALEAEGNAIGDVARLVHFQRDLHTVLRNFVTFADFYDPATQAVFQAGTLYLDARSCDLCVRVDDPATHATLAAQSKLYLAYCDCRRPGETMKIAACFTQGDSDFLAVGRNGVFFDRKGRDWDATIVKIVENPISLRAAFWAPYKKVSRFIEDQVQRFAAAREKEADARLASGATGAGAVATGAAPPPPQPVDVGKMVGIVAALGVGVGALGALLGGFVAGFLQLEPWWTKLVALAAVVLAISAPSMLLAWLKLRQRNLGPVLDANGWAIHGRVKINVPLGTALTDRAVLPRGAHRSLADPFVDEAARRRRLLVWLLVIVLAGALAVARFQGRWPFAHRAPPPAAAASAPAR